jgi:hypothetical protein
VSLHGRWLRRIGAREVGMDAWAALTLVLLIGILLASLALALGV